MICDNSSTKSPGYEIQGLYGGGDTQYGLTSYIIILQSSRWAPVFQRNIQIPPSGQKFKKH